jgi:DNA-3-methyladenine glycosylase
VQSLSPLPRSFFDRPSVEVAPDLLGCVISHSTPDGCVAVRLTEVEAYMGEADPGSHAYRGKTARNAVMYGEPGHVYVYFTYGMHFCMNLVCMPEGTASAVLLRAGEVVGGVDLAMRRRLGGLPRRLAPRELARGPARMTVALGIDRSHDGLDACAADGELRISAGAPPDPGFVQFGPRTGVSGAGAEIPWRWYIDGEPTVSPYRAHVPKRRRSGR